MPIYEYICEDCGARYEKLVLSRAEKIACPKCSSERRSLQLSTFSTAVKSGDGASRAGEFSGGACGCGRGGCGCH